LNGKRVSKSVAESYAKSTNSKLPKCLTKSLKNESRSLKKRVKYYKEREAELQYKYSSKSKSEKEKIEQLSKLSNQIDDLNIQVNNCRVVEDSYNVL
jgi:hypothetical protein